MDATRTLEIVIRAPLHAGSPPALETVVARYSAPTAPLPERRAEVTMPGLPPRGSVVPRWGPSITRGATPEPGSRLAAAALPGGAALWDFAYRFREELKRLSEEGRRLRARWRRMAIPGGRGAWLHVRLHLSRALDTAYRGYLEYVLGLFFGGAAGADAGPSPGGGPAGARDQRTYGLTVTWELVRLDEPEAGAIRAYQEMLEGTRLDHAAPEKLRAFLLSGQADWAVRFGMDLAGAEQAKQCWPSWFREEHRWLHLRDLRWHMLGGHVSGGPGGLKDVKLAAMAGPSPADVGPFAGQVGDLPSLAFLGPAERRDTRAPEGWRRPPRTMRDWVGLLGEGATHPWRVPGTLGGAVPATPMSALLTFQAGVTLLRAATDPEATDPHRTLWLLRHAQVTLLLAFRGLIEHGGLPEMVSGGLWLAWAYAELGHAGVEPVPRGLGDPPGADNRERWLRLADARVENAADLLLQAGCNGEEAGVRDAWARLDAAVRRGATPLVRRYARQLVSDRGRRTYPVPDVDPRLLFLGDSHPTPAPGMTLIDAPTERPEHEHEPWTGRRAHVVIARPGQEISAAAVEHWFPNGDAPVVPTPIVGHVALPDRDTLEASSHRSSAPPFRRPRAAWPRGPERPTIYVNYPADASYSRFEELLRQVVEDAGATTITDFDPPATPPDRRERILQRLGRAYASIHDLSRYSGQGPMALARMNMPFELGLDLGRQTPGQRVLLLVDAGEPIESYLSDIPACRGFLVRGYRGRSSFERAVRDALWVWGSPRAWTRWRSTVTA